MPCVILRARTWQHRILLEANENTDNCFCNLTYRDEALPRSGSGLPTLEPEDLRNFNKRLRTAFKKKYNRTFRFYAVGEYGDDNFRPHYHLALFGFPSCAFINSRYSKLRTDCCPSCDLVRDTWGLGQIFLGTLEAASAGYVASYVTKKMTRNDDPRLLDRHPEFSRQSNGGGKSRKGGLGAGFMHDYASALIQFNLEETAQGDVPSTLRHGKREMPLGRYLRRKLRTLVGKEPNAPYTLPDADMLALQQAAQRSKTLPSLKAHLLSANKTKALSIEKRFRIYKPKGKL